MKKLLLLIIFMMLPLFVFAKEYNIEDIGVKLSVDDSWYVFTRDNYKNNPNLSKFSEYSITEEYLENFFYNNKIYLEALPSDLSYDLILDITAENLDMTNLSNFPSKMIEENIQDIISGLQNAKYSISDNGKNKYIVISFLDTTTNYYIYRYYTVFDNKGYSFHIQKPTEPTESDKKSLDEIMKTVVFDASKSNSKENKAIQKSIDNYNNSKKWYENILIDALIGALVGAVSAVIFKIVKKKKSSV